MVLVEALGNELFVHFTLEVPRVGENERIDDAADMVAGADAVDAGVARVAPRASVRAGERTTFAVDAEWLHFFDPDSGAAVGIPATKGNNGSEASADAPTGSQVTA